MNCDDDAPFSSFFVLLLIEDSKEGTERRKEAPEKYQITEDVAAEEFGLLNRLFGLVNEQMMEKMGDLEAHVFDSQMITAPKA